MLSALLTLFVFGIVGIVVISVAMALLGVFFSLAFGLAGLLLFKVAPLLLLGWVVVKAIDMTRGRKSISKSDQRWLDS